MRHSHVVNADDCDAAPPPFGQKRAVRKAGSAAQADIADVIEAEFETISPHFIAPAAAPDNRPVRPEPREPRFHRAAGMALFSDAASPATGRDDRIAFYGFGCLLVAFAFWVSGGHALATRFSSPAPAAAAVVLSDAQWRIDETGAAPALLVEGILRNSGTRTEPSRAVTVVIARHDGKRTIYTVGAGGWHLAPGQEVVVSGRLDMAPLDITRASIASVDIALATSFATARTR